MQTTYQNKIAGEIEETSSTYENVGHDRPSSSYEVVGTGPSSSSTTYEDIGLPSWAQRWSVPSKDMVISKKVLGSGNFGEVLEGAVVIEGELFKAVVKKLKGKTLQRRV